jgi:hypothetical protein
MFLKIIKWIFVCLLTCLTILIILLGINSLTAINTISFTRIDNFRPRNATNTEAYFKELETEYGRNKIIPFIYKKQILMALSHYPELKRTPIDFIVEDADFPLQSQPSITTLLIPFTVRKYNIIISARSVLEYEKILLGKIPFQGQIGVIGHELSHVVDYESTETFEVVKIGVQYLLSSTFRVAFERKTDLLTIDHGLGCELLEWREYYEHLLKSNQVKLLEGEIYFEDRYLTSHDIKKLIGSKRCD